MHSLKRVLTDLPTAGLPEMIGILDIETGGLSSRYYPVLLLGLAYIERERWVIESHLCESREEENLLLSQWARAMHQHLLFLTYNGKRFDLPYLRERATRHQIPLSLPPERHIDLYQSGRLVEVEKQQGFIREDTLSGADWVALYRRFEKERLASQRDRLLLHNQEDLIGTIHLLLSRVDLLKSLPARFIENRFLFDISPFPDNLRLLAIDSSNQIWTRDLPLLSFGRYHFLHIGEAFDQLEPKQKEKLLLLDGRTPLYTNITSLEKNPELHPYLIDKKWRQC